MEHKKKKLRKNTITGVCFCLLDRSECNVVWKMFSFSMTAKTSSAFSLNPFLVSRIWSRFSIFVSPRMRSIRIATLYKKINKP